MKNYNSIEVVYNRSIGNSFDAHTGAKVKLKCKGPTKYEKQIAEKLFLRRVYTGSRTVRECQISSFRANFLIVFSPDGKKLASTNGNHNVYIIDVATNKVLNTLTGHKRTPWTVAFHPTDNNILASGCLNGEVRVWNLSDDTFESWQSPGQTVIASVAFHPKFNLLAIATYRDIYFWDWNTSIIFEKTSTEDVEEKIRYIKFDSSGDKLITAIALKNNILSQYDSIAFREVFQFSCEKRILKDVKLIESFCETNIQRLENLNEKETLMEELQTPDAKEFQGNNPNEMCKQFSLLDKLPYMCAIHSRLVIGFLNVDCFCPTRFSSKIMNMLKTSVSTFHYRIEKCYFCRYTWLYYAVFQVKMLNVPAYHTCKEFHRGLKDFHVWSFSATRSHELLQENSNELNGITEETLRYCFEQFARIHIAPHFARIMPGSGLCSNYFSSPPLEHKKESENISDPRKSTFVGEIGVRSDCFLGFCANFQFLSSGTFVPFLASFVELYHLFPALHQISTKDDKIRLNLVMTEWEHLYCKLLLINKIIEGDEVILKKRSIKSTKETVNLDLKSDDHLKFFEERQHHRKQMFHNKRSSQEFTKFMKQNEKLFAKDDQDHEECSDVGASTSSFRSENIPVAKNNIISENDLNETNKLKQLENNDNCKQTNRRCSVCRKFDQNGAKDSNTAFQLLRKDIDILSSEISHRNDPKMQRHRIEELYKKQLETEIGRSDGALFITLQIIKKCIRMRLSNSIMELKRLLKVNFTLIEFEDINFSQVYSRLFIFAIKRIITFTRSILDFLCEYKYNVSELTEMVSESRKATSSPNLSSTARLRNHQQHLKFRRNYGFDNDEPIFKEEGEYHKSELSDDESNADVPERSRPGPSNQSTDCGHFGLSGDTRAKLISKKVVASRSYINKHLKFLECASDRRLRDDSNINGHEIILLQNVNLLLHQLQNQSERNVEYSSHPLHRLQVWDFSQLQKPDISNRNQNVVVSECKVHNDATISISHDSTKVAVLLSPNQYDQPDWLGVFSMEWKTLGQILCSVALNQVAVSLSFSPTDHYLAVGFSFMYLEDLKMADIIFVQQEINSWRDFKSYTRRSPIATSLIDITFVHRTEFVITVNCIRWSPIPGQGLIFGNSFGEIKFVV